MIESLDVMLWGRKAGTLVESRSGYRKQICFYFDPEFAKHGYDIAPLRAPLSGVAAQRGLPVYPEENKLFGGLPSFIADSMPDHWGNLVFAEWVKSKKIRTKDLTPLDRLAYIGRRGMGALEFIPPASSLLEGPFKVSIPELSALAMKAVSEARNIHAFISEDFAIESLFKVGTSAGGRRPKAVINFNTDSGECYSGQVAAPIKGFTPMIIKFDEHIDVPTTRIEYSYYLMALEAGIPMMSSSLLEQGDNVHFVTRRFDRNSDSEKIHVQTLAAMNPLADSYEDLFDVAFRLRLDRPQLRQLFLQMTMNVLAANIDDHNKNFSFIMASDGVWHAAPAYDFTFTVDTSAPDYINRHSLTLNGRNSQISREDLLALAKKFDIKSAPTLINKALSVISNYREFAMLADVPEIWINRIEAEIQSRLTMF